MGRSVRFPVDPVSNDADTRDRSRIRTRPREYRLDTDDAGEFPVALGERLRDDDLTGDEGELPFRFGERSGWRWRGVDEPELAIDELPGHGRRHAGRRPR